MQEARLIDRSRMNKFPFLGENYMCLLWELTISRFKLSEQTKFMGFLWTLLYPVLSVGLFYVLFSSNVGQGIEHFAAYLFSGMIMINLFSNATNRGLGSILQMRGLLKNARIPFEIPVISEVSVRTISFFMEIIALFIIMAATGVSFTLELLLLPYLIFLEMMLILSISTILAVLNVFVSDIIHIWSLMLSLLFFTTPVFYNVEKIIPPQYLWIYELNPLASIMMAIRDVTIFHTLPATKTILYLTLLCFVMMTGSFLLLKKVEPLMAEEL